MPDPESKAHRLDAPQDLIVEVIAPLPAPALRTILTAIEQGALGKAERVEKVRGAVVTGLNRRRPQRLRRLAGDGLQPWLTRDAALVCGPIPIPGCFDIADVGAVWSALAAEDLADLAREAGARLDREAGRDLIENFVRSDEGLRMRATLCAAMATALRRRLARDGAAGLLQEVERRRLPELASRLPAGRVPRRLRRSDIELMALILESGRIVLPAASGPAPSPGLDPAARGAAIAEAAQRTRRALLTAGLPEAAADAVPLAAAARGDVEFIPWLVHAFGPAAPASALAVAALAGRTAAACADLTDALSACVGQGTGPLSIPPAERQRIERSIDALEPGAAACRALGLLTDSAPGAELRGVWEEMIRTMNARVLPAAAARISACAMARRAAPDIRDAAWTAAQIHRWGAIIDADALRPAERSAWSHALLEDLAIAVREGARARGDEGSGEILPRLARIGLIAAALGASIGDYMSVNHLSIADAVRAALPRYADLSGEERTVIDAFAGIARDELAQLRYWKDATLAGIVQAHADAVATAPS